MAGVELVVGHQSVAVQFLDDGQFHPVHAGHIVEGVAVVAGEVILSHTNPRVSQVGKALAGGT